MKILIAADMEGITGVVNFDQTTPGHPEYERFRRLMTEDVNAAVRGAFAGGAGEVIVSDGHWDASNILIEQLDPRARLNSGTPRPYSMLEGIDGGVDGVLFVGYHAQVGTLNAVLDHTWSSFAGRRALVDADRRRAAGDGRNRPERGGVRALRRPCPDDLGRPDRVRRGRGPLSEHCDRGREAGERPERRRLPAARGQRTLIEQCAARGVQLLRSDNPPQPLKVPAPVTVTVEFVKSQMADSAAIMPGARRVDGKRVEFVARDMPEAYRAFRALVGLA